MTKIITIDGPSGAGKGTVSKMVAERLGFHLLDSGALYRIVALASKTRNLDINDGYKIADLIPILKISFVNNGIYLDEQDVSRDIRSEEIGKIASQIAQFNEVRERLLTKQRDFAKHPGLVADGRDMGTVIFPAADLKIFLTASSEERANRRYRQLINMGKNPNLQQILADIIARDEQDFKRAVSPLIAAKDAHIIDSSYLNINQVVELVVIKALECSIF